MICEENKRLKWIWKGQRREMATKSEGWEKKWLKRKKKKEMVEILQTSSWFYLGKWC